MKIKDARGRADDIAQLEALLQRPGLTDKLGAEIDRELRAIRAGEKGEREAAYEIDFHHGPSRNWAVIHDLRIEHEGRVAQMDHVLIGRFLDIWVCETKHFAEGVAINDRGEFTRFFGKRPTPIPSPLEQNRRHLAVLDHILKSDKIALPSRLGIKLRPTLHSVVLVSQHARIARPKTHVEGIDRIVKSDQLRSLIERTIDDESAVSMLMTAGKLLSSDALNDFARQVARLHRPPPRRDWEAFFSSKLAALAPTTSPPDRPIAARTRTASQDPSAFESQREPRSVAAKDDLLSTSKLGAVLGLANAAATLERLRAAGYLVSIDGVDHLTAEGKAAGGQFVAKSRFGPYFLWPRDLRCSS